MEVYMSQTSKLVSDPRLITRYVGLSSYFIFEPWIKGSLGTITMDPEFSQFKGCMLGLC